MQVYGFLVFPDTKEEWEESINDYKLEGYDFIKKSKENLELRKTDLLKFLPESFHPYIIDGTLKSEYPSVELRKMADQWKEEYNQQMKELNKEYFSYYNSIKDRLPKNAVQLIENSLHDATVKSFDSPSNDTFILILDCRGGFHYFTDVKLTFTGVEEFLIPEKFDMAWWLYNEIYPTKAGFELRVLFDCPLSEIIIAAENVLIEVLND